MSICSCYVQQACWVFCNITCVFYLVLLNVVNYIYADAMYVLAMFSLCMLLLCLCNVLTLFRLCCFFVSMLLLWLILPCNVIAMCYVSCFFVHTMFLQLIFLLCMCLRVVGLLRYCCKVNRFIYVYIYICIYIYIYVYIYIYIYT
jgi:hypothetical protein